MFASVTANPDLLRGEGFRAGGTAAGLYLTALAVLVGASLGRWVELPDPELPDPIPPFRVVVEMPLERARPGSGGGTPRYSAVKRKPPWLVAPSEAPPRISASDASAAPVEDRGDPGSEPPGDPSGTEDGGETQGIETDDEGPTREDGSYRPGGDVKAPVLVNRVDPVYPELSRRLRQQGPVTLRAIITAEGTVEDLRVAGSASPLLDEAALTAVRQWRYRPGTLNGRGVRILLTVTVDFRLH